MSSTNEIVKKWKHYGWKNKFEDILGKHVELMETNIKCLKDSREKTSIWKLMITNQTKTIPLVLKIYKPPLSENHMVEINMYQKGINVLQEFMPKVYWIERNVNKGEIWMFIEYVEPLRGQIKLEPKHFDSIIPTVAKFHSQTFEKRLMEHSDNFNSWLPSYNLSSMGLERQKHIEKTKEYLDLAMQDSNLKELVSPSYYIVQQILKKGPLFFPEIIENGQSVIHGDLHIHNISCHQISDNNDWQIRLVDWESAKFAPVWFDLVVLVEILIDFRTDWHQDADEIRKHCVNLYVEEMKKYGITFQTDPHQLLKMAYLQRTLEKRLLNHLRRVLRGEKSVLLSRYLEKINVWGKELGLYDTEQTVLGGVDAMEQFKSMVSRTKGTIKIKDLKSYKLIGKGADGSVFQINSDRCVKVFQDTETKALELRALQAGQSSRYIPTLYEDGSNYIVMEYVNGISLSEYLKKEKQLPKQIVIKILAMLADLKIIGFDRCDTEVRHILFDEKMELRIIDLKRAFGSVRTTPTKLMKGLKKKGHLDEFMNHVKELNPVVYEEWKDTID